MPGWDSEAPTEHWIPAFAGMTDSIKFGLRSTLRHSGQAKRGRNPARFGGNDLHFTQRRPVFPPGLRFAPRWTLVRSWSSKRPPQGNRREYYRKFSIIMISDSARSIWDQAIYRPSQVTERPPEARTTSFSIAPIWVTFWVRKS
jgi:hypothetical protein